VGALAPFQEEGPTVERGIALLRSAKYGSGGWDFDLRLKDGSEPHLLPSIYVLHALVRARRHERSNDEEILAAIQFCLPQLAAIQNPDERGYLWKAAAAIGEYEAIVGRPSGAQAQIVSLLKNHEQYDLPVTATYSVRYQVEDRSQSEDHAFCELLNGLLQVRAALVARRFWNEDVLPGLVARQMVGLCRMLCDPLTEPFTAVRSCSLAARIIGEYGSLIDWEQVVGYAAAAPRPAHQWIPAWEGVAPSATDLETAKAVLARLQEQHGRLTTWLKEEAQRELFASVGGEDFVDSEIDPTPSPQRVGFFPYLEGKWRFDIPLFLALERLYARIDDAPWEECVRLFLMHEGFHVHQGLTAYDYIGIGRTGFVLEGLDYDADAVSIAGALVWRKKHDAVNAERDGEIGVLTKILNNVVQGLVAFDEAQAQFPLTEMPERRLRRYLIWLFQW